MHMKGFLFEFEKKNSFKLWISMKFLIGLCKKVNIEKLLKVHWFWKLFKVSMRAYEGELSRFIENWI